jgi:5'-nucleotidase
MKDIVYVYMDNVLVDFNTGLANLSEDDLELFEGRYDEVPHIFLKYKTNGKCNRIIH